MFCRLKFNSWQINKKRRKRKEIQITLCRKKKRIIKRKQHRSYSFSKHKSKLTFCNHNHLPPIQNPLINSDERFQRESELFKQYLSIVSLELITHLILFENFHNHFWNIEILFQNIKECVLKLDVVKIWIQGLLLFQLMER